MNIHENALRRLMSYCLALILALSPAASVFAAEEYTEEPTTENQPAAEVEMPEIPQEQPSSSAENTDTSSPETTSEDSSRPAAASDTESEPLQDAGPAEETATETADCTESAAESGPENDEDAVPAEKAPAASASASESTKSSSVNTTAGSVSVGDTSFNPDNEESSHWQDGKGWKNVAGKYVAMVDYDGRKATVSADGGTLTLAVAGVNRIGKLAGNCSIQISGTGIVLIDSIEIADGNTITLHPNAALYDEGSAAVFLKQNDGSYLLINGETTGILDEVYELDNVRLVVPKDSSLLLSSMGLRKETWYPDDASEPSTEVTRYLTDIPYDANHPVHDNGNVEFESYSAKFVIGKNGSLSIQDGASVRFNKIEIPSTYGLPINLTGELVVQGILEVIGILENGLIDISKDGSLKGNGTVRSAEINLDPAGSLSKDIILDKSGLTVHGNYASIVLPQLHNSNLYVKGFGNTIPELNVSGISRISIDTGKLIGISSCKIGNINLTQGSRLEVLSNDHQVAPLNDKEDPAFLEDSCLEISGLITGGAVHVLAGCVEYTGNIAGILPVVPSGYASRVYVPVVGINSVVDIGSTEYPVYMSAKYAAKMAESAAIPVSRLTVLDTLLQTEGVQARSWIANSKQDLKPLVRTENQAFSCADFLKAYNQEGYYNDDFTYTAIEVIYKDLHRDLFFLNDDTEFSTKDVIMIRILDCIGQGGQGGSSATHTNAAFTGSGVIGGPGSGAVQAGKGAVIFTKASYTDPVPTPDPKPDPDNKGNTDDKKKDNNSKENNKENSTDNRKENNRTARINTVKTAVASAKANGLVVTVSLRDTKSEDQSEAEPALPQIWHLDITNNGVPVTDFAGSPVKVLFPFTVPENWGNPAEIPENSLYAVFADENGGLAAYSAQYDPKTGEITFDAEQTGDFIIVKFAYSDEPFTENFYRALAELEEIRLFLAYLRD